MSKQQSKKDIIVEKILEYLEGQKDLLIDELQLHEASLYSKETGEASDKDFGTLILRKQLYRLQGHLKVVKLLLDGKADDEKILNYLEGQKDVLIDELKIYEMPATHNVSEMEREALLVRKQLYQLEGQLKVIKLLRNGRA